MTRDEINTVREWAHSKIATGEEPPWAWYQYMKLIEALDAITSGMDAVTPHEEGSPGSAERRGNGRLRVVSGDHQENAQRRPDPKPVQLPM